MRKLRILALGAALLVTAVATQRPAVAYPNCSPAFRCICPGGLFKGCLASAAACSAACGTIIGLP